MRGSEGLLFGTAGIPPSSRAPSVQAGIERVRELGLGCMEVEFVQGVRMNPRSALEVRKLASDTGIKLSAHAPYFINLNSRDPEKLAASRQRILQTARIASLFGGESIVFHAGYYMNDSPPAVYAVVRQRLEEICEALKAEGNHVRLRPEVMGKTAAFGTLDEILGLSAEVDGLAPAVDFAHWHARTGEANTYPEFAAVLRHVKGKLGEGALEDMHIHVSGIEYGPKGERRHRMLTDSDFNYVEFLSALKDWGVKGRVICESPDPQEDALMLQRVYREL